MRSSKTTLDRRLLSCLPALAIVALAQCGEEGTKPPPPPNERPSIRILTGGASSDSSGVDYRVDFTWRGEDPDGSVVAYEYAIDDTASETSWHRTEQAAKHVDFAATTPVPGADGVLTDWHSFHVRSVDDDSARSVPDRRYFNARTIAPTARITSLMEPDGFQTVPTSMIIRWVGEDADGPDGKPMAYEYKLVRLRDGSYPSEDPETYRAQIHDFDNLLSDVTSEAAKHWVRVAETVRSIRGLPIEAGSAYAFAVRAVDAAGATEPVLVWRRNLFTFQAAAGENFISITASGYTFSHEGSMATREIPAGTQIRPSWTGYSWDGAELEWNYAYDIPDPSDMIPSDPQGMGGWIGWGDWSRVQVPIQFGPNDAGTTHFLYIRARRSTGKRADERLATMRLIVVQALFEKFALLVDDASFTTVPDPVHDRFVGQFLRRLHDYGQVELFSVVGDSPGMDPVSIIPLSTMARYRHIIWSGEPGSLVNGLSYELNGGDNNNQHLAAYLSAGGRLFFFGDRLTGMERSDFGYPVSPPVSEDDRKTRMLYYRFFHLRDWIVSGDCAGNAICGQCYSRTSGLVGARALNPAFPDLTLDSAKWDPWQVAENDYLGGIPWWEGSMHLGDGVAEAIPGLDSLYAAETWDRSMSSECAVPSPVSGAICGLRYESTAQDSLENRSQGRAIVYLFQPYYFLADQAQSAGTAAIEWLVTGR